MPFTTAGATTVPIPVSVSQGIQTAKDGTTVRPQGYNVSQSGGRQYAAVTTATTTSVAIAERLCKVIVTGGTMGAVTIYDNPSAASGPILWARATSVIGEYDVQLPTSTAGFTIVTASAVSLNASYE